MKDIQELISKLEKARRTYYNNSKELVLSDTEYDILEDTLRTIDPENAFFNEVGSALPKDGAWPKVTHRIPMGSLHKAQNIEEVLAWERSARPSEPRYLVTEKLDGISVSLHYVNGTLSMALTRGDGITGENIVRNASLMQGVVKKLPSTLSNGKPLPKELFIRGEIVCGKDDFKHFFQGESNPRNTASGTAKRIDKFEKCSHLTVLTYQILSPEYTWVDKVEELNTLAYLGFRLPRAYVVASTQDLDVIYQKYIESDRELLDYDIDGLVVEISDTQDKISKGESSGRPKGAVALKFPHEMKQTVLKNIRWQVGRSGRITPVAEFESVALMGANVKQATLHNISNIADLTRDVRPEKPLFHTGDILIVSRRNDVIPGVESLVTSGGGEPLLIPTQCPSCNSDLQRDGEYLVCRSLECEAQASGAVKRWVSKIGVLHVGEAMIEALVESGIVKDAADLYDLDADEVAELELSGRRVGASADKAIRNLNAKKILQLHVIVGSLGIPLIGRDMAKKIVDAGYDSLRKMLNASIFDIACIPGLGEKKAQSFVKGYSAKMGLITKLIAAGIEVQKVEGPLLGKSFCLTGFRDPALTEALEKSGGTLKSGVSRGLDYLIAQDPDNLTGKLKKAQGYGTIIIGTEEAWNMLED